MSSRDKAAASGATTTATSSSYEPTAGGAPPTYAAFSPVTLSANTPSRSTRRSTILVHQKSPLLLATPPQITRALAYSHPFLLPLNTFVGLLTWSTGDPWQSFLLVCAFWAVTLYGDAVVKWAGPVMVGIGLIAGMYGRRYSPLSSSGWTETARDARDLVSKAAGAGTSGNSGQTVGAKDATSDKGLKHRRGNSELTSTKHQKTLDEIVETMKEFTGRCNVLMDPLLEMTDFLSTQRTPTSATTKPALIAMFTRLLVITPFWIALTLPPWRVITTRRVVLVAGTIALTWHAKVLRVSRTLLWRSATVRRLASAITGLRFDSPAPKPLSAQESDLSHQRSKGSKPESELAKTLRKNSMLQVNHRRTASARSAGVKFTFIIYENQRRWVGLGWTSTLFAYERSAWTDEHNNPVPPKEEFELPDVEDGSKMKWQWADGSRWRVDGVPDDHGPVDYDGEEGRLGWIFYDNKWQNGRRGQDGWGRWTRRRKWYRDAELVEVDESELAQNATNTSSSTALGTQGYAAGEQMVSPMQSEHSVPLSGDTVAADDDASITKMTDDSASVHSTSSRSFFPSLRRRATDRSVAEKEKDKDKDKERTRRTSDILDEEDTSSLGTALDLELQQQGKEGGEWGIGDEARMSLE